MNIHIKPYLTICIAGIAAVVLSSCESTTYSARPLTVTGVIQPARPVTYTYGPLDNEMLGGPDAAYAKNVIYINANGLKNVRKLAVIPKGIVQTPNYWQSYTAKSIGIRLDEKLSSLKNYRLLSAQEVSGLYLPVNKLASNMPAAAINGKDVDCIVMYDIKQAGFTSYFANTQPMFHYINQPLYYTGTVKVSFDVYDVASKTYRPCMVVEGRSMHYGTMNNHALIDEAVGQVVQVFKDRLVGKDLAYTAVVETCGNATIAKIPLGRNDGMEVGMAVEFFTFAPQEDTCGEYVYGNGRVTSVGDGYCWLSIYNCKAGWKIRKNTLVRFSK